MKTVLKPQYYASIFPDLKDIAFNYGYNLVLHGSMLRDFDLIAISWIEKVGDYKEMLSEFGNYIGSYLRSDTKTCFDQQTEKPHGRIAYTINISHHGYLDISILPTLNT